MIPCWTQTLFRYRQAPLETTALQITLIILSQICNRKGTVTTVMMLIVSAIQLSNKQTNLNHNYSSLSDENQLYSITYISKFIHILPSMRLWHAGLFRRLKNWRMYERNKHFNSVFLASHLPIPAGEPDGNTGYPGGSVADPWHLGVNPDPRIHPSH
jgi:hypothetical protein